MSTAATVEDAYPLTMLQAGMLFHSELDAGASIYHDLLSLRVTGPFVHDALLRVLDTLIARHEVLRVTVDMIRFSEPMQLVHAAVAPPLTVQDLRPLPHREQWLQVMAWRAEEKGRPFDLSVPPMLRVHVQRVTDASFWLNISFHHAILDGWSLSLLTSSLLREYDRVLTGHEPEVAAPRSRFRDYVALERRALAADGARAYWQGLLERAPVLELPRWYDPDRPSRPSAQRYEVPLPENLAVRLRDVAAKARTATKAAMFAAHASVLSRLSGQDVVVTGRVANCRPETVDADQMLGVFLNTNPLVVNTRQASWLDLVRQVHDAEVAAVAYRRYPMARMLRDLNRDTLFETLVDYRNMRSYAGLPLRHLTVDSPTFFEQTNFPFTANFQTDPADGAVRLRIDYDAAEFPAVQIETIGGYYAAAFEAMTADPTTAVTDAPLLGSAESARILVEWNDTAADLPPAPIMPRLLASAVERQPDKVALRCRDRSLTYAELNSRANRLAWRLRDRGAGPDTLVGIHMRRSADLIVAVLAVLKAGAAYLPLDPDYPVDRLAFMLADSKAPIVLADTEPPAALAGGATVLTMETERLERGRDDEPPHRLRPEHLAYVIYTSGSTGRPKGVEVSHRALVNLLSAMARRVDLTAADRWLAVTSLSFDISGLELFAPLMAGAELVLLPEIAGDGPGMLSELRSSAATIVQATPSAWQLLVEAGLGTHPRLRAICGGEAMPPDLAWQLTSRLGSVWNAYGPTETTIWSCLSAVSAGEPVTIGGPLANTEIYVLDADLRPVPTGVPGELYIGGEGLARGYHARAALTATRFVPSRWGRPGSRLFRTGDLARWRPDGRLDFLGRLDHQVKVRGHRIELGEVESVLGEHPAVGQAVVVAGSGVNSGANGATLVAYLTAGADAPPTGAELRRHLAARLPDYMVPSAFVVLGSFPLTPNGKVDRKALPEPGRDDAGVDAYVEPATETERVIAGLWAAELGLDRVGATDTFRDLGGHSIAALRLVTRINKVFDAAIPLGSLLTGTVRILADLVDNGGRTVDRLIVALREASGRPPCFIIHALGGGLFGYTAVADALPADQPLYGLQAFEFAGLPGPHPTTIEAIAERYLREVRAVQPRGPYHLTGWCLGGVIAYEMARQLQQQGERIGTLVILSSSIDDPVPPEYAEDQAAVLLAAFGDNLAVDPEKLRELDPDQRLQLVMSLVRQDGTRPDIGTVDELDRLVRTYQRHSRAVLAYRDRTRPPYRGDVLLVRAETDRYPDGDLGWAPRVQGRLIIVKAPGDHHSMLSKKHADGLAHRLAVAVRDGVLGQC
jgi:amino acid adenylation domain-containing protein